MKREKRENVTTSELHDLLDDVFKEVDLCHTGIIQGECPCCPVANAVGRSPWLARAGAEALADAFTTGKQQKIENLLAAMFAAGALYARRQQKEKEKEKEHASHSNLPVA